MITGILRTGYDPGQWPSGSCGSWIDNCSYAAPQAKSQFTRRLGRTTTYSYDTSAMLSAGNLSRLLSVLHQLSGSTIDGATYTVDNAGNRTAKTDNRTGLATNLPGSASRRPGSPVIYGYDAIYQLSGVWTHGGSPTGLPKPELSATQGGSTTESYSGVYPERSRGNAVGNRLSSLGVSPYSYNPSNEMVSTPTAMYVYDANGNLTSKTDSTGTTNYTWDYENRLTQVTLPGSGGTVTFKYDPFGRRIYKSSSSGTSIFAYDGVNLMEETNASGTVVARYSQGQNIDEPLAMSRASVTSFYQADGLGSVTSLTSGAGALSQTYTFDSFGKQTGSSGSLTNPFQYTARELDPETGLYYYRARYYDPAAGRFVSEDPARFPGGINFYTYVENNSATLVDPFGFCPWEVHDRPLKGFPGAGPLGLQHYYFYNPLTGQSLGLGPLDGVSWGTLTGGPVPGTWETHEKPGHNNGSVPDWGCSCVDRKVKNPGKAPNYCTYQGNGKPNNVSPHPPCTNCAGWVLSVLQDCYNQAYAGQQ